MRIAMAVERIHLWNMPFDKNGYHATGDLVRLADVEVAPDTLEIIDIVDIEDRYWNEYEDEIWEDHPVCKEFWEEPDGEWVTE